MLWLERQRRHDELHPTKNGLTVGFTNYGGNTAILISINRKYVVSYNIVTQNGNEYSGKFPYLDEYQVYRKILFDGILDEIKTIEIGFDPYGLSSRCGCQQIGMAHWMYSPTEDELKVVGWIP